MRRKKKLLLCLLLLKRVRERNAVAIVSYGYVTLRGGGKQLSVSAAAAAMTPSVPAALHAIASRTQSTQAAKPLLAAADRLPETVLAWLE